MVRPLSCTHTTRASSPTLPRHQDQLYHAAQVSCRTCSLEYCSWQGAGPVLSLPHHLGKLFHSMGREEEPWGGERARSSLQLTASLRAAAGEWRGRQLCAVLEHQHGPRWQPRPGTSAWPLVVALSTKIYPDPCCCMATEPGMALSARAGCSHKAVPHYLPVSISASLLFLSHLSTTNLLIIVAPAGEQGRGTFRCLPHLLHHMAHTLLSKLFG